MSRVTESAPRRVRAVTVGQIRLIVMPGVDDEAQAEIDLSFEGVVIHADTMAGGERFDRLRRDQLVALQKRLVKNSQLANRAVRVPAGARQGGACFGIAGMRGLR